MRLRLIGILVFASLLTLPLAGQQALVNGATYALRGSSGLYLSAYENPVQQLGLSPNMAGWEQWRYVVQQTGVSTFISYHGTMLIVGDGATPFHGPRAKEYDDRGVVVRGAQIHTDQTPSYGTDMNPVVGGSVTIGRTMPSNTVVLADKGTGVGLEGIGTTSHASQWWTVIAIPAPDMNRKPIQEAATNPGSFWLKSYHNDFLYMGSISTAEVPAVHSTSAVRTPTYFGTTSGLARAMTYGDPMWLRVEAGYNGKDYFLAPGTGRAGQFNLPTVRVVTTQPENAKWILVDPTGRYRTGDRVPVGAKVSVRNVSTNTQVSADSAMPQLVLSPNLAGWEIWTLSN